LLTKVLPGGNGTDIPKSNQVKMKLIKSNQIIQYTVSKGTIQDYDATYLVGLGDLGDPLDLGG
jgi:hypothetical protein